MKTVISGCTGIAIEASKARVFLNAEQVTVAAYKYVRSVFL